LALGIWQLATVEIAKVEIVLEMLGGGWMGDLEEAF
jgi:hypothetical protein